MCYDMDDNFKITQNFMHQDQARSIDYSHDIMVIGFFAEYFETYFVNDDNQISLITRVEFPTIMSLRFMEDHRDLFVASYGEGFQQFRIKNLQLKPKWGGGERGMKLKDTKISCLVRLKKNEWLAYDWDKLRYILWNKKKQSYKVWNCLSDGRLVCGEKLSVRYPFGMLNKENKQQVEYPELPFVVSKTETGIQAVNFKNHEQIELNGMGTNGLLNQKLVKVWKIEEEVTDIREIEFFTTYMKPEILGNLAKFKINIEKLLAAF